MIKQSIILLILALFTSGCVERGQIVYPNDSTYTYTNTHTTEQNIVNKVQPTYALRITAKDRKIDPVKNTISGTLILLIGLMILL